MRTPQRRQQSGFFLIEALVAILIFSIGILGMVAMGGTALGAQSDARFRTDAATLAEEMANTIALNVARDSAANFNASLLTYQYREAGADCAFNGAAGNPDVVTWVNRITAQGPSLPGLPGATATSQQIVIDPSATGFNRVQITVCWRGPSDQAMRRHTFVTYINGLAPTT